jgi:hypothetical protein
MMQSSSPIVSVYFEANHRGKRRHRQQPGDIGRLRFFPWQLRCRAKRRELDVPSAAALVSPRVEIGKLDSRHHRSAPPFADHTMKADVR